MADSGKTTDVRYSDVQVKKFRCPIPMFNCSVMLNYTGEAGDVRWQRTIASRLAGRPRVAIWMHVGGANYVIAHWWQRTFEAGHAADDN